MQLYAVIERRVGCPSRRPVPFLDSVPEVQANRIPDLGTPISAERLGQSYPSLTGIEVRDLLIYESSLGHSVLAGQYWRGGRRTRRVNPLVLCRSLKALEP